MQDKWKLFIQNLTHSGDGQHHVHLSIYFLGLTFLVENEKTFSNHILTLNTINNVKLLFVGTQFTFSCLVYEQNPQKRSKQCIITIFFHSKELFNTSG